MKIANAIKPGRIEEVGLKKTECFRSVGIEAQKSSYQQGNKYRETDQYPTWSATSIALQSRRRTSPLLSDDGS
jgi:hypothetical protein